MLIINLVDNDHRWRDTVVRVSGPWKASFAKDRGCPPTVWNRGSLSERGAPIPKEMQERFQKLCRLRYDCHNWSWLLDSQRPFEPPTVPRSSGQEKTMRCKLLLPVRRALSFASGVSTREAKSRS